MVRAAGVGQPRWIVISQRRASRVEVGGDAGKIVSDDTGFPTMTRVGNRRSARRAHLYGDPTPTVRHALPGQHAVLGWRELRPTDDHGRAHPAAESEVGQHMKEL